MTNMFKIDAGSRSNEILHSSDYSGQFKKLDLEETSMETVRVGDHYYIIITGTVKETRIQGI